jgi:hypothetical protein
MRFLRASFLTLNPTISALGVRNLGGDPSFPILKPP